MTVLPPSRRARLTLHAALCAAAITAVVTGLPPLLAGGMWGELDLMRIELGTLCALKEQLRLGHGARLSSLVGNGAPLWGVPTALLYPFRWFQLLWPSDVGVTLQPVVHLSLGAGGAAWLARTFGVRPLGAACAGVAFALSGVVVDLMAKPTYVVAAAWMPIAWAATRQLLGPRRRVAHAVVLGAALTLQLLGGEPHSLAMILGILIVEATVSALRAGHLRRLVPLALVGLGGTLAGLTYWAPSLLEVKLTSRATGLGESSFDWSFGSIEALASVWPAAAHQLVAPGLRPFQLFSEVLSDPAPWAARPYVGLLWLCAAVVALGMRRTRTAGVIFVGATLLALGDTTPVLPTLHKLVPPLERFRYPAKYLLPVALAGAVLGAALFERVARSPMWRRRLRAALIVALVANGLAALAVLLWGDALAAIPAMNQPPTLRPLPRLDELYHQGAMHTGVFAGAALVLTFTTRRYLRLLPLVVVADLLAAFPLLVGLHPPLTGVEGPLSGLKPPADATPADVAVICTSRGMSAFMILEEEDGQEYEDATAMRQYGVTEMQACDGVASPIAYTATLVSRATEQLEVGLFKRNSRAARALGCVFVIDEKLPLGDAVEPPPGYVPPRPGDEPGPPLISRVVDPVPPAFIARSPELFDEDELPRRIAHAATLEQTLAIVDDPAQRLRGTTLPAAEAAASIAGVEWDVRHEALVEVTGAGPAVVGLRSSFWYGWEAEQAEEPLPVVRVAGTHVAAVVEDLSRGPVRFIYRIPNARLAILLALSGLVLVMAGAWSVRRRGPTEP